ncbi:MAG: sodium:proton antiporter [Chlorobiaceae bacterium]|nr:sodium:proton antiporter [Chlorobiaceae bacterium]
MKDRSGLLWRGASVAALLVSFMTIVPDLALCGTAAGGSGHASLPPVWVAAPFVLLLLMIATGPLFYPRFWEHNYKRVSIALGGAVALWYGFRMEHGTHLLLHTLEEYLSFISLISALFVVAGGILIRIGRRGSPLVNGALLFFGAILANVVGTTGASMLLIRPYLRINEGRLKAFHIVFFIFIVSNVGGGLTPIGDPPLFLGFLRGVPFFWVLAHVWMPWLFTVIALCVILMVLDFISAKKGRTSDSTPSPEGRLIELRGSKNFIYLALLIVAVFLDPAVIHGFPSLQELFGLPFGIRELIMAGIAVAAYKTSDQDALAGNEFNFEPIKEVGFLFIGIFATMIPALQLIGSYAQEHAAGFSVSRFYWSTGFLSGVLDNAPTYLNFLAGSLGKFGLDPGVASDVARFAHGMNSPVPGDVSSTVYLMAISIASVFFGALTYIGNAPNFMVKNIAEQAEADVPSFVEYIYRYSVPVLLPIFAAIWYFLFNR